MKRCTSPGCRDYVALSSFELACEKHWRQLPYELRAGIRHAWSQGTAEQYRHAKVACGQALIRLSQPRGPRTPTGGSP